MGGSLLGPWGDKLGTSCIDLLTMKSRNKWRERLVPVAFH
jgi:hypothetical protein